MLPDIDVRLQNVLKAINEVVIPALPKHDKLATEQAILAAGHLEMIRKQWSRANQYENGSLLNMIKLAKNLLSLTDAEIPPELRERLSTELQGIDEHNPHSASIEYISGCIYSLGRLIDEVILADDRSVPLPASLRDAVLEYGQKHAERERIWFQDNHLDPERSKLPPVESLFECDP